MSVHTSLSRKMRRPKSSWRRDLQNEPKKKIKKSLNEALTVAASKENWKYLVHGLRST